MQAGAADLALLDEADGEAELARAQCGCVAAAARTQHDKVKVLLGHPATPCACVQLAPRQGWRCGARDGKDFLAASTLLRLGKDFCQSEQGADGRTRSGPCRSCRRGCRSCSPPRRCRGAPTGSGSHPAPSPRVPTKCCRNSPATSIPPTGCPGRPLAMSATSLSSMVRSSAGSGIAPQRLAGARAGRDDPAGQLLVAHDRDDALAQRDRVRRRSGWRRRRSRRAAPRSRRRARRRARGDPRHRC